MAFFPKKANAASDVFRTTTYELQTGEFVNSNYTLNLNNDLSNNYFVMVTGPSSNIGGRAVDEDRVRVSGDSHSNFGNVTASNQLELTRGSNANDWIGSLTVIECLVDCAQSGFQLSEVLETSLPAGTANAQQTFVDTLSSNHTANTVPFGGLYGGGMSSAGNDNNAYATTLSVKLTKTGSNEITYDRFGGEARVPAAATFTTFIVEWGSDWDVQNVNVAGTNSGTGLDALGEYDTAAITSVNRDNTWVWGGGFNRDDGLGDGPLGQVITLGDGVNQNPSESLVAVGSEGGMIAPGRDFQVYVMSNASLQVDYRFRIRGDQGAANGFQLLNQTVDSAIGSEVYDNAATDVQYSEGYRAALFYTTSGGTGQAYSRTGAWGLRHTSSTNLDFWRAYAGQPVTGWFQSLDFANFTFSNVSTEQIAYRWRDDSAGLNVDSGWLAGENNSVTNISKNQVARLRVQVVNVGTTPEDFARNYELQYASKTGITSCSAASVWVGVEDNPNDDFGMASSVNISPDGVLTTTPLLSNGAGYTYVNGQAKDVSDTTSNIGPISPDSYTEIEYSINPTDNAITGRSYCFRLYDTANITTLDSYVVYPELEIAKTDIIDSGLGEAGTFNSAVDGGWTTVNFVGNYTNPVVVGTTNSVSANNGLVFEVDNVLSDRADMRVCRSRGSTANGCGSQPSETVGYMVVDADVAAVTDGIDAGSFSVGGEFDTTQPITNFSASFSTAPYLFANVNTVTGTEFPTEVLVRDVTTTSFTSGLCEHLQGNDDFCDPLHPVETVGWIAIEPGNEPFLETFDSGIVSIGNSTWTPVSFSSSFVGNPVVVVESQTDNGGQDVTIDEADLITSSGAQVRYCEIDTENFCDTHNADDVAWFAIEPGEFTKTVRLDQDGYRFYENNNSTTPTVGLAAENTSISNVDDTDIVRLRLGLQNGDDQAISAGGLSIKLQYKQASNCEVPGPWTEVGGIGSGAIWRGFNNATPADGTTLTSSLLDGGSNILQSYEEENNSVNNPNSLATASRSEWDFVIQNNNAPAFTEYCFRVVSDSDEAINYTRYPKIITDSGVVNLPPNNPTNLNQQKTSLANIVVGEPTNESTVIFSADATDQNNVDLLELCVEVVEIGTAFTDVENACGAPVSYSAISPPADVSVSISGFNNDSQYHWQARTRDSSGVYSAWVSFGGNLENERDFYVDNVAPTVSVFDGSVSGIDIEYNSGELDEISANWENVEGVEPDSLTGLSLWLDGSDVNATGVDPSDGSPITEWFDKSGLSNDITGTGAATFDDSLQAVSFNNSAQPFDDTYDRSGGNTNSQTIFSVVTGNATDTNAVWYETTTPRVAPGERGMLGAGTTLTDNNLYSSIITDKKIVTLEYLSTGTSTTWLDRAQEFQFSETQVFANTQRLVIGDDTTGGNAMQTGEYIHELLIYNEDMTVNEREDIWRYLDCKWSFVDCSVTYDYSIGTSPGATNILNWTDSLGSTNITEGSLSLQTSQVYYVNVRATDVAGNQSVSSSDGQLVAPTLSFSVSGSGVDFDPVNSANSFTSTKTSTLTTSTNARNGYAIRSRALGPLENPVTFETVPFYDGGTYSDPSQWIGAFVGYGYTSSDTLVQGVNKFNPAICSGGGAGPCYAPFTTSEPGDIVADNPGPVTGTAINNEQFTITHRVTTNGTHAPGDYQTTVIYSATAIY